MAGGRGHILISTRTASNLVPDVLFAHQQLLDERRDEVVTFLAAWLEGAGQLAQQKDASLPLLAQETGHSVEDVRQMVNQIRPARFADNREFFGLEHEHSLYQELFVHAEHIWEAEGLVLHDGRAEDARWLAALQALAPAHANEMVREDFDFSRRPALDRPPLLTKSVTINFPTGGSDLDRASRKTLDSFAEELDEFGNAFLRVEGHTDNVGSRSKNLELSQRRARAVADHLVSTHHIVNQRVEVVGLGSERPKADNRTSEGRDFNRRTDLVIIPNEGT
jgi:outer membrane protein OmpA-like peptidoglycan-associated protein